MNRLIPIAFLLASGQANGEPEIWGAGAENCEQFLSHLNDESDYDRDIYEVGYMQWFAGYVSGRNAESDKLNTEKTSLDMAFKRLKRHCRIEGGELVDGADIVYREIYPGTQSITD